MSIPATIWAYADVTIDGKPYTGPVKVVAGTKITVAATAKPGYSFAADPSGEYTITGDRTINAKATANGRTITVIGEANIGGEKTITKPINEEVEVVLTAENGYAITSVDCNVAAKIDTKTWTVAIPAGLENVVIDVETKSDEYTYNAEGANFTFTVENAETGNKLAVGRTYTVKVEAKNAGAQYNGYYLTVDGVKVDGTLTAGGSTLDAVKIDANAAAIAYADGKTVYTDSTCNTEATKSDITGGTITDFWVAKTLNENATGTYEFTVAYQADGQVNFSMLDT